MNQWKCLGLRRLALESVFQTIAGNGIKRIAYKIQSVWEMYQLLVVICSQIPVQDVTESVSIAL